MTQKIYANVKAKKVSCAQSRYDDVVNIEAEVASYK